MSIFCNGGDISAGNSQIDRIIFFWPPRPPIITTIFFLKIGWIVVEECLFKVWKSKIEKSGLPPSPLRNPSARLWQLFPGMGWFRRKKIKRITKQLKVWSYENLLSAPFELTAPPPPFGNFGNFSKNKGQLTHLPFSLSIIGKKGLLYRSHRPLPKKKTKKFFRLRRYRGEGVNSNCSDLKKTF